MIAFINGIYHDLSARIEKMLAEIDEVGPGKLEKGLDQSCVEKTVEELTAIKAGIDIIIASGELEVEELLSSNISRYNIFNENLSAIEIFRFLVIINYGEPEVIFKKKIARIYKETKCMQQQPTVTTISNSEDYYWVLDLYNIIAVPRGEEKNLLNLPDIFHEMGHLIHKQHKIYFEGDIKDQIKKYFDERIESVDEDGRPQDLKGIFKMKAQYWNSSWVMELICDFIATYLVGVAYGWTNLKISTQNTSEQGTYSDSLSHPSDEVRMRAILFMLQKTEQEEEFARLSKYWDEFLFSIENDKPSNYDEFYPQHLIETLGEHVWAICIATDLKSYSEQVEEFGNPISKILNDAWKELFANPDTFKQWEKDRLAEIRESLG